MKDMNFRIDPDRRAGFSAVTSVRSTPRSIPRWALIAVLVLTAAVVAGCQNDRQENAEAAGQGFAMNDAQASAHENGGEESVTQRSAAETKPPFGGPANVEYASVLWTQLKNEGFVGPDAIRTYPYEGQEPHGAVLEYIEDVIAVDGKTGAVMVKKNYIPQEGMDMEAAEQAILNGEAELLDSVTVMFQREDGYDRDHGDWYWAKYAPDGSLLKNPKDMALGGRVAKGVDQGCIACHQAAPGGDYTFTHDRWAKQ